MLLLNRNLVEVRLGSWSGNQSHEEVGGFGLLLAWVLLQLCPSPFIKTHSR